MKRLIVIIILLPIGAYFIFTRFNNSNAESVVSNRDNQIDADWRFFRGDIEAAKEINFDDSKWRNLDLPHDWSIEDLPLAMSDSSVVGPFSKTSAGGRNTGHVIGGIAWYRKQFKLPVGINNKSVVLRFDGIYSESEVWFNGHHVGFHPNGYTPFNYDVTKFINENGKPNIIAVRVKNEGVNSRWYSGSGIYRHVWLTVANKVHVPVWGVNISSTKSGEQSSLVNLKIKVENGNVAESKIIIKTKLFAASGNMVGEKIDTANIAAQGNREITQNIEIKQAILWSLSNPHLYKAIINIFSEGKEIDSVSQNFGVRYIDFSVQKGFLLNGEPVKLKGACIHHDNGILGAATYDRAEERKIELLQASGFNAIRTSHNPPSQQLLDACDRLGMLVIDEAFDMWERPKRPDDYHKYFKEWWQRDLESMLLRDRNHPSIIMWSFGNEISERADTSGIRIAKQLVDYIQKYDTSRPVTQAICLFWKDGKSLPWNLNNNAFKYLNVGGYNYQHGQYVTDHKIFPQRIMLGTESVAKELFDLWKLVEREPYVIGDFVWTGMDYIGEAGIGNAQFLQESENINDEMPWPWFNAWCGDIDICGRKKPQSFYRDVIWGLSKIELAVLAPVSSGKVGKVSYWGWPNELQSWTWPVEEGTLMKVAVHTSCPRVRLELNGKVIGEKRLNLDSSITTLFDVPYQRGELKVYGLMDGNAVVAKSIKTAGSAKSIKLTVDRNVIHPDRNDLAFITVDIIDEKGASLPDAEIPISISVSGGGQLLAAGNASPNVMASYRQPSCKTFRGQALIVVRPFAKEGKINVHVESKGFKSMDITVNVNK
jgi:beta-galactosidase